MNQLIAERWIDIGGAQVKLADGTYQAVNVVGLDDASLFGHPEIRQGNILDIYADDAFMAVRTRSSRNWRTLRSARHSNSTIAVG